MTAGHNVELSSYLDLDILRQIISIFTLRKSNSIEEFFTAS